MHWSRWYLIKCAKAVAKVFQYHFCTKHIEKKKVKDYIRKENIITILDGVYKEFWIRFHHPKCQGQM